MSGKLGTLKMEVGSSIEWKLDLEFVFGIGIQMCNWALNSKLGLELGFGFETPIRNLIGIWIWILKAKFGIGIERLELRAAGWCGHKKRW
jgi:hypothetical protein